MPTLTLSGCAPVPLAHYLKALGVFRLVTHRDASCSTCWNGEQFVLSSCFDRDSLCKFLLYEYCPTPVLNPWNGDGGFFKDSRVGAVENLRIIANSTSERFISYRETICVIRAVFDQYGIREKPSDEQKNRTLLALRNTLSDEAIQWIDSVAVLTQSGPKYPPLLGSGGNDGSIDFSKNFIQRLSMVIDAKTGTPTSQSPNWLAASLFQEATPASTTNDKIGQFFPGAAGGANATSGFNAEPSVNPWDFILMIEGALLFAAASVKRLENANDGSLVYPFCVRQAGVGYASASRTDEINNRCEIWLPVWKQLVPFIELQAIFGEGRAQVRGHPARNGVDFAQAIVTLGVDRGITAFHRYALLERNGQSNFATPLGRVIVQRNARVDLLADIQQWFDRLRFKSDPQAKPKAPNSVATAFNLLERRVFELCQDDSAAKLQAILTSLGGIERALAKSFKWATSKDKGQRENIPPLHRLRPEWFDRIEDCAEVRLAASLAAMRASFGKGKETLWFRHHLEPLKRLERGEHFRASWTENSSENDVVWHEGELTDVLNLILARRIIRVEQSGVEGWPDESPRYAQLKDITNFIEGRTDDALLADLLWGLSLIDWQNPGLKEIDPHNQKRIKYDWKKDADHREAPSSFYALLKLCFQPQHHGQAIPLVPAIHHRARSGQGVEASKLAVRRLRGSGYPPLVKELEVDAAVAQRTAAALLFPISPRDLSLLEHIILHPPEIQNP